MKKKQSKGASSSSSFPIGLRQREITEAELVELSNATEVEWILQSVTCAVAVFVCAQAASCIFAQTPHINVSLVVLAVTASLCLLFLVRDLMFSDWLTVRQHTAVFVVSFVVLMFCLQLPSSLLDVRIRESVPVIRGRFLNVKTSLDQNTTASTADTSTDDRQTIVETVQVGVRASGDAYDDVTPMEWMFVSSCFAFVGASIAALMLKPARLTAKVFRHATGDDNVRDENCCTLTLSYAGFFAPLLMVVCWVPPLTANMLMPFIDQPTWHSIRTGFIICGCLGQLATTRDQVQMYLDAIRPEFANLASTKAKVSASRLIEFVMHRVRSVCPVVLALVSVAVVPMCLAMILKDVAGINFVEVGSLRICPASTAEAAARANGTLDAGRHLGTSALIVQKVLGSILDEGQMVRLEIIWKSSSIGYVLKPILEPFVSFLLFAASGSTCVLGMLEAATV
jgi:hypothetical protein